MGPLVPRGVAVPDPPSHRLFRFEVLGPEHNAADLSAWGSSIGHIRSTHGFGPDGWPQRVYSLEENRADLAEHRDHHERHLDFAWTVLDAEDPETVVGCVYVKPDASGAADAEARSWVRADRAALDLVLRAHVARWLATAWPIRVRY